MNNREQGNMLFLKMCKMEVSSPCTCNIDDPNSLYLTAQAQAYFKLLKGYK